MKRKVCIIGISVFILLLIILKNVYAMSAPFLRVTGNTSVKVGKTIQLKAEYGATNDIYDEDRPDSYGRFFGEDVTNQSTWSSSDNTVASVDNKGMVTGIKEGIAEITAKYYVESSSKWEEKTFEIKVTSNKTPVGLKTTWSDSIFER